MCCKSQTFGTPKQVSVIIIKFEECVFTIQDADRMANSVDADQTAPSWICVIAQTCLLEYSRSLWYIMNVLVCLHKGL